jgi:hypothetical protein
MCNHRSLDDLVNRNKKTNLEKTNNKIVKHGKNSYENNDSDDDNYNDNYHHNHIDNNNVHNNKNINKNDNNKQKNFHKNKNSEIDSIEKLKIWICTKCKKENDHLEHCEYCATKRSAFKCTPENMKQLRH